MSTIGSRLKESREKKGLLQSELAKMIGVKSAGVISNWEQDVSKPDANKMVKLCQVLGISLSYLLDYYGEKTAPLYSSEAMQLAKDYDGLDGYGKRVVRVVADEELARCQAEKQEAERQARAAALKEQKQQMEAGEEITPEEPKVVNLRHTLLKASAGTGYQLDESYMTTWKVLYNEKTRKADFCLEIDGHSMEPMFYDGDIILVRQQPSVDIGEIGLFTVGDKEYVKRQGKNEEFGNIVPSEYDTFFCRGKVIGVLDPNWIVER